MRRFFLILTIVVLAVGLAQPQTLPAGWVKYSSVEGKFTVLLPVNPQPSEDKKTYPEGDVVTHMFLAKPNDLWLCAIGYTDYPMDVNAEKELAADRDNFVKEVGATISTTERTNYTRVPGDLLPALQFVATSDAGTFKGTVVLDNRRAYIAVTFNRAGSDHTADIERFFSSFKLTK
ncbi:MAG: hypothetical protein LAO20_06320 [Acidobacteriia bacterium]|nr:hypothetical protein [Terriglobia bacterium]